MVAQLDFPRRPAAASRRSPGRRRGSASKIPDSIFGSYIDEPLVMVKANGDRFFFSTNDLYSTYALTDATGAVVERYMYDPYGKVTVLEPDGVTVRTESAYGNPWTFTGRRLDGETGLMQFRTRAYDCNLGRFLNRMPWQRTLRKRMAGLNLPLRDLLPLNGPWRRFIEHALSRSIATYIQNRYSLYDFEFSNPVSNVEPFSCGWQPGPWGPYVFDPKKAIEADRSNEKSAVSTQLKALCNKTGCRPASCTLAICTKEADQIADDYVEAFHKNKRGWPYWGGNYRAGHLCFEWRDIVFEAVNKKYCCWKFARTGFRDLNACSLLHNWVTATVGATPQISGKCTLHLDPWLESSPKGYTDAAHTAGFGAPPNTRDDPSVPYDPAKKKYNYEYQVESGAWCQSEANQDPDAPVNPSR